MNNVTNSIREMDVQAIATAFGPTLADFTSFIRNPEAQGKALKLFLMVVEPAREYQDAVGGTGAWEKMEWSTEPPLPNRFEVLKKLGASEKVLGPVRMIVASPSHYGFVMTCVEFVRKAQACQELEGLAAFLSEVSNKNEVQTGYAGEDEVIVSIAKETVYFGPNTPATKTAWPYVVNIWKVLREKWELVQIERREKWAQTMAERRNRTDELTKEATPGLTLAGIVDKRTTGTIVLQIDHDRVALLHFFDPSGDTMEVEVLQTNYSKLVWRPIKVELPDFKATAGYWPTDSFGFPRALREQLHEERGDQKFEQRLTTLRTSDLLPEVLGHQSMQRVLLGQQGSALAYHPSFSENGASGFLGITISQEGGKFILAAVESDIPFPQDLVGKELPLRIQNTNAGKAPYIGMDLMDAPEEHRDALDMVRRLLVIRIRQENRQYTRR